jgi:hypothetical protein
MTVNASIRNYLLSIGGLNCTAALMEFSGSDTKLDQSGLVTFSGQMKLGRPVGFEVIDDRINNRWSRGAAILFDVANESNILARPTRFGTLFISDAIYDRSEANGAGRLNLQVVDLLGLLMNAHGEEDAKPKACVGEGGQSALGAINQLLSLAGVPAPLLVTDPIPGNINAPINGGGGYIQTAGSIAAAQGWFLYIDGTTGRVRARSIDVDATTPIGSLSLSGNAANFSRLPDRPPAQKMVVSGTGKIVTAIPQTPTTTVSRTYGTAASIGGLGGGELLIRERYNTESITGNVRTVSVVTYEALGSLFPESYPGNGGTLEAENVTEVHTYEAQSPVTSGGSDCEKGNQGRLLSTVITTRRSFGTIYKALYEHARNPKKLLRVGGTFTSPLKSSINPTTGGIVGAPFTEGIRPNITDDTIERINYQYFDPDTSSGTPRGRGPLITRTKTSHMGAVVPDYFAGNEYRPIDASNFSADVTIETERQYWHQTSPTEWRYEHTLRQSQILKNEGDVRRSHDAAKQQSTLPGALANGLGQVDAKTYANLVTAIEEVTTNGNNTPPAPTPLPPKYSIADTQGKATYDMPIDGNWPYRERSQTLSFDYLTGSSTGAVNAAAYGLARIWGVIGWGRYRGSMVQSNLTDYLHTTYRPADRVDVNEVDFVSSNLADGYAVGMAGAELLVSLDCMYLGRVANPGAANSTVLSLDGLRSIGPADRFDGQIAFQP